MIAVEAASAAPDPEAIARVVAVLDALVRHFGLNLLYQPKAAGLLTDIDGTISPIAPTPEAARVAPGIAATLDRAGAAAWRRGGGDGARRGRRGAPSTPLVGTARVLYLGNHGMERRGPAGSTFDLAAARLSAAGAGGAAPRRGGGDRGARLTKTGLRFEDKGVTRVDPLPPGARPDGAQPDRARAARVLLTWRSSRRWRRRRRRRRPRAAPDRGGGSSSNCAPPVRIDKGTALGAVVDEYALRGAVFLGDDVTDIDAMRELWRRAGRTAARSPA